MRQILLNSDGAFVARMPRPAVNPGDVLVRSKYSLISVGTEIAALQPKLPVDESPLDRLAAYGQLARSYLGKAVRDPHKAGARVRQIIERRLAALRPPVQAKPASAGHLEWRKVAAQGMDASGDGMTLRTDKSEYSYQAISSSVAVPDDYALRLDVKGSIDGGVIGVGLLSAEDGGWVAHTTLGPGLIEDSITFVVTPGVGNVTLVVANAGAGCPVSAVFERIGLSLLPPETGVPHSEMDQQGWNVGYSLCGEVMAVGAGVTDLSPGDVVVCAGAGKANHADYVSVKRNLVCKVPRGCDPRWAATTTVGAIALQGVRRAQPQLGEKVAVLGMGLIGQITAQLLRASGCTVIGFDLDAGRIARAPNLEFGASDTDELRTLVRHLTFGRGVDRTVITAATKSNLVINLAMELTRQRGTVVIVGDVGLGIDRANFYKKEIDLLMSTSYGPGRYDRDYEELNRDYPFSHVRWTLNRNMESYLDLVATGRIAIEPLIDKIVPVADARQVYGDLLNAVPRPLGVLIQYGDGAEEDERISLRGHRKVHSDLVNYVLVGAGAFGQSMLVPMLDRFSDRIFFRGVVSSDAVRGGNFARSRGSELLASNLASVVEDSSIHMLVIATRHDVHAGQVVAGLRAGKHVFVEKPLALTWEQLQEVETAYGEIESPPVLMVGFNRRFSPALQRLKLELEGRKAPLTAIYRLNAGYIPPDSWIQGDAGGGRNLGEACHMYDCFRFLTGARIRSIQAASIDPSGTAFLRNDNFTAMLTYEDGSLCTLVYTASGPKQGMPKERLEVFCDGSAWVVDDYKALYQVGADQPLWSSAAADKGHEEELRRLAGAVSGGEPSPIPFEELMEVSATTLAIEDQLLGRL